MPRILSSRKLSPSQAQLLLNAGVSYVEYNALSIDFNDFTVNSPIKNAIVTSQNTVKSILRKPLKINRCFCVGQKTKKLLEEHHIHVEKSTHYGKALAELLVKKYPEETFTFFCGNRRRPELPAILTANHIDFKEIQVYKTRLNPKAFHTEFDGILFFSPSQVKSFVQKNTFHKQPAFCIGTTTAAEAQKHTTNVITATKPTVENVIAQVVKTLTT